MKYEKEATTNDGRRTWKVTYELVRGPEPKKKREAGKNPPSRTKADSKKGAAPRAKPAKPKAKKPKPKPAPSNKDKAKASGNQLGFF